MIIRFTVPGIAVPQGSKSGMLLGKWLRLPDGRRAIVNPRVVLVEGRKHKLQDGSYSDGMERHKRWRKAVATVARAFNREYGRGEQLSDRPISMSVTFYLPRPASLPKRVLFPTKKPDLSKLVRSVEDSLTGNVFVDDSQIVTLIVHKRYVTDDRPRAEIAIEELPAFRSAVAS